ncbi:hypothetical protein T484DRAFT_1899754 [Baffinella frigidus]|nr:hypothetical protein T484DRAFT_1899754 [Cryptophyta sp. CCMP2293]
MRLWQEGRPMPQEERGGGTPLVSLTRQRMMGRGALGWAGLAVVITVACYAIAPQRVAPSLLLDHEVPHQKPGLFGELSRDALALWQGVMVDHTVAPPPTPKLQQHASALDPNARHYDVSHLFDKTNSLLPHHFPAMEHPAKKIHPAGVDALRRAGLNFGEKDSWGVKDRNVAERFSARPAKLVFNSETAGVEALRRAGLNIGESSSRSGEKDSWGVKNRNVAERFSARPAMLVLNPRTAGDFHLPRWHSGTAPAPAPQLAPRHSHGLPGVATDGWPWTPHSSTASTPETSQEGLRAAYSSSPAHGPTTPQRSTLSRGAAGKGGGREGRGREGRGIRRLYQRAALAEAAKATEDADAVRVTRQLATLERKVSELRAREAGQDAPLQSAQSHVAEDVVDEGDAGPGTGSAAQGQGVFLGAGTEDGADGAAGFRVRAVASGGEELTADAPDLGDFPLGPARLVVTTKGGGVGIFPYATVTAASSSRAGGLTFTAPLTGSFPIDAATVRPTPRGQV